MAIYPLVCAEIPFESSTEHWGEDIPGSLLISVHIPCLYIHRSIIPGTDFGSMEFWR
jgi:hypothetical protein